MSHNLYLNFKDNNKYEYECEEEEDEDEEKEEDQKESNNSESEHNKEESSKLSIKNPLMNETEKTSSSYSNSYNESNENISDNISDNSESSNNLIKDKNQILENKEQNILNYIIHDDAIINSIIIYKKVNFINILTEKIVNINISKNKKICYLISDYKKAKNLIKYFSDNKNIKPLLLQKIKSNKNDYSNFRNQIKENNLFILNSNIFYKLLSIGFFKIFDFGLIIFDECHLCSGNHQYNLIMQEFYFYYIHKKQKINLPNIIGYTSSSFQNKNKNQCIEELKTISENLNCQILIEPSVFDENTNEKNEDFIEYIKVDSYLKDKNIIDGINLILMKFFFEKMFNLCFKDLIKMNGVINELKGKNALEIKKAYLNTLKRKFVSEDFEKYNNIETAERSLHFLSNKSILFKAFEEMQKHLILIIQNMDLNEIYNFFENYKNLYEDNLKNIKESNEYYTKIFKKMINIFKICMHGFQRLIEKNVKYKTDKLNKLNKILNDIYNKNKNNKTLIFVQNRKIANILYNYLNRDNNYKNKSKFLVGSNSKKEENIILTLATRNTTAEINNKIKEYNENKINILICTLPTLEYLDKTKSDYILIFGELLNRNNCFEKIKEKAKKFNSKLIVFSENYHKDNINKEKDNFKFKELFMEEKEIKYIKDFREKNFIEKKNNDKIPYYYICETEAKISIKNCMMLFNEIKNFYISKGLKIHIEKKTTNYKDKEQQFICNAIFNSQNNNIHLTSNIYNDKQSAENDCYMKYLIFLHQKRKIDNNFQPYN